MNITFVQAGPGLPVLADAGKTVTVSGAGCVLRVYQSGDGWAQVETPYAATESVPVRMDCDVFGGEPIHATLSIL